MYNSFDTQSQVEETQEYRDYLDLLELENENPDRAARIIATMTELDIGPVSFNFLEE